VSLAGEDVKAEPIDEADVAYEAKTVSRF